MNLYQSCKAHMNAVFAVKKGGIMILTLECPDIKEPAIFTDWFSKSDVLQFEKDVRADFSIPAFVAFPLVGSFVDVGASIVPAVAFLTTLTMVGIVTFPLEKKEFGFKFALIRNAFSFVAALLIAAVMGVVL